MKALIVFVSALTLTGCACVPKVEVQTVKVPVAVSCVKEVPVRPDYPFQSSKPDEDIFTLTKKALAEIELRKGYEGEMEAVLKGCTSTSLPPR